MATARICELSACTLVSYPLVTKRANLQLVSYPGDTAALNNLAIQSRTLPIQQSLGQRQSRRLSVQIQPRHGTQHTAIQFNNLPTATATF